MGHVGCVRLSEPLGWGVPAKWDRGSSGQPLQRELMGYYTETRVQREMRLTCCVVRAVVGRSQASARTVVKHAGHKKIVQRGLKRKRTP